MICVSIVSHGHGKMVSRLAEQILACSEVCQLIITLNIAEDFPVISDGRLQMICNEVSRGFGANHNAAFAACKEPFFCVLNPDIELTENPFPQMLAVFDQENIGLAAPMVVNPAGAVEDSMRVFLTPWSLFKRLMKIDSAVFSLQQSNVLPQPDWVAGMFMLFRSEAYTRISGFDEWYFMYCEDADICTRLWRMGYKVVGCVSVSVIHNAQRASRRSLIHLLWHVRSMARYLWVNSLSLPNKD